MNYLSTVTHDIKTNTLEAMWRDSVTLQVVKCTNYSPTQVDILRSDDIAISGINGVEKYIVAAGWTPEFVAAFTAEQERLAAEVRAKADAEAAEKEAARIAAEQAAFDAEVLRQAEILKAAQALVAAG